MPNSPSPLRAANGTDLQPGLVEGYAGDVDPITAFAALRRDPTAVLIDVRTAEEWDTIGVPDLADLGTEPVFLEWHRPDGSPNGLFVAELAGRLDRRSILYMLCRSGVRSKAAAIAATSAGFPAVYNVAGGFEGPLGPGGKRATVSGWQFDRLPWKASR